MITYDDILIAVFKHNNLEEYKRFLKDIAHCDVKKDLNEIRELANIYILPKTKEIEEKTEQGRTNMELPKTLEVYSCAETGVYLAPQATVTTSNVLHLPEAATSSSTLIHKVHKRPNQTYKAYMSACSSSNQQMVSTPFLSEEDILPDIKKPSVLPPSQLIHSSPLINGGDKEVEQDVSFGQSLLNNFGQDDSSVEKQCSFVSSPSTDGNILLDPNMQLMQNKDFKQSLFNKRKLGEEQDETTAKKQCSFVPSPSTDANNLFDYNAQIMQMIQDKDFFDMIEGLCEQDSPDPKSKEFDKVQEKTLETVNVLKDMGKQEEDSNDLDIFKSIIGDMIVKKNNECDQIEKEIYAFHKQGIENAVVYLAKMNKKMYKSVSNVHKALNNVLVSLSRESEESLRLKNKLSNKRQELLKHIEVLNTTCTQKCLHHAVTTCLNNEDIKKVFKTKSN